METNLKDIVEDSFSQYAGAVIQSRALVDVRDCVKPSARQVYYSLYTDGFTFDKPFRKTLKAIGSTMRFYIHGDSSCEGILMRSGQPFSMRYPLVEVEGSFGNQMETGNWAAPRYTASRLSELATYLLEDTDEHCVEEWVDNYDDTEQYPRVLASKGFYNIVNGTSGIAVGVATSIPQFNIREVNNAICLLLDNPDTKFDDIYCSPDFATGGTIINAAEVKESLRKGEGRPCIIRATVSFDEKDNCLIVKELPYSVYTNTVCAEIEKVANSEDGHGIVGITDLTGESVCIKIYLEKKTDWKDTLEYLYQNTSLQNSYSINMMMLEDGRYPKIFGWREALLSHIENEKDVYKRGYEHRLEVLRHRLKILNALIKAVQNIDEVISVIKSAESTADANQKLQSLLNIEEFQAKAILDIRLARLSKLEIAKLKEEQQTIISEGKAIKAILENENLLIQEMKKRYQLVAERFGDARRTKIVDRVVEKPAAKAKVTKEPEKYIICLSSDYAYLKRVHPSKFRSSDTNIINCPCMTNQTIRIFTSLGKVYRIKPDKVKECLAADKGTAIASLLDFDVANYEHVVSMDAGWESTDMCIFTTLGKVKRFDGSLVNGDSQSLKGIPYIKLQENDSVVSVHRIVPNVNNYFIIETLHGRFLQAQVDNLHSSGKASSGQVAIKMDAGDEIRNVMWSHTIYEDWPLGKVGGRGKIDIAVA